MKIEHTIAEKMSELQGLLHSEPYINALGALTGNQAVQMAHAGLKAIYLSGWQVAADNNLAGCMYPDRAFIHPTACRWWFTVSTKRSNAPMSPMSPRKKMCDMWTRLW